MNPIVVAAALAMAISLAGNIWLAWTAGVQREEIGRLKEAADGARDAAKACSDGVIQMKDKAEAQAKVAEAAIKAARQAATDAGRRADAERSRPQAVPGDECASAAVESREWLRNRRGAQ